MTTLDPAYEPDPDHSDDPGRDWDDSNADWRWEDRCPSLDPALCADGCGRLAETERPATGELVCRLCALPVEVRKLAAHVRERAAAIRADETERPRSDGTTEQVCGECAVGSPYAWSDGTPVDPAELTAQIGEHSSNPREDG